MRDGVVVAHNPCLSGGSLEIFLEPQLAAPRIVIAGDTPIARALAQRRPRGGLRRAARLGRSPRATRRSSWPRTATTRRRRSCARWRRACPTSGSSPARSAAAPCATSLDVDDALRAVIHTPAGLDIGARTPADIAISILAQIVAERTVAARPPRRRRAIDPVCGMEVRRPATRPCTSTSTASASTSAARAAAPRTLPGMPERSDAARLHGMRRPAGRRGARAPPRAGESLVRIEAVGHLRLGPALVRRGRDRQPTRLTVPVVPGHEFAGRRRGRAAGRPPRGRRPGAAVRALRAVPRRPPEPVHAHGVRRPRRDRRRAAALPAPGPTTRSSRCRTAWTA